MKGSRPKELKNNLFIALIFLELKKYPLDLGSFCMELKRLFL